MTEKGEKARRRLEEMARIAEEEFVIKGRPYPKPPADLEGQKKEAEAELLKAEEELERARRLLDAARRRRDEQ